MIICSRSVRTTKALGRALGQILRQGDVVGLEGDLGSGKTCLTQGIALGLGVDKRTYVTSPSFTILKIYQGRLPLYHLDLYRLESEEALWELGLQEIFEGDGVVVVEWYERLCAFPALAPKEVIVVRMAQERDASLRDARRIVIEPPPSRLPALSRALSRFTDQT